METKELTVLRNEIVATYKHLRRAAAGHGGDALTHNGEDFACESCANLEDSLIRMIDRLASAATPAPSASGNRND